MEPRRLLYVEAMHREALRQNEPELREFREKLHNDYVRKSQACQIKEKEYKALQEKVFKSRESAILAENNKLDKENEHNSKIKDLEMRSAYGRELQSQMEKHQKDIVAEKNNIGIEKEEIAAMIRKYEEEDLQKHIERKNKITSTQHEMELFKKAKEAQIEKQRLELLSECQNIEKTIKELEQRYKIRQEEIKKKMEARESLKLKLAENLQLQQTAREERIKLIEQLREFEYSQEQSRNIENRNVNKVKERESIRAMLKAQIDAKLAQEHHLEQIEAMYTKQLQSEIDKQIKDEENEKIINNISKQQYSDDIKHQIDNNQDRKKQTEVLIKATNDYVMKFNQERERRIEEEKVAMLREHLEYVL